MTSPNTSALVLQWRRAALFSQDPPGSIATIIGPPGATGPQGSIGPQGPQGNTGPQGPTPTSFDGGTI